MSKQKKERKPALWFLLALLVLALLAIGVYSLASRELSAGEETTTNAVTVQDDSSAGTTKADATYSEIDAASAGDSVDEDGEYVTMECRVKAVDADAIGYFDLEPLDDSDQTIACYILDGTDQNMILVANSLSVGQSVTVSGELVEDASLGDHVVRFNLDSLNKN